MPTPLQEAAKKANVRYETLGVDEGAGALNVEALNRIANEQAASNKAVADSSSSVEAERRTKTNVNNLTVPDPQYDELGQNSQDILDLIDKRSKELSQESEQDIFGINAFYDEQKRQTGEAQKKETATTNVALARTGGYLGTQMSGVGVLNNLAETHRVEIASIENKRLSAISQAKQALADGKFKLAQLKVDTATKLKEQIYKRRQEFFDNSLRLIKEQEDQKQNAFKNSLETIERITPTLVEDIAEMSAEEARDYIVTAAKDLQLDPNMLAGEVNAAISKRRESERKEVVTLAGKYLSANIDPETDTFATASEKIRSSREYKLDIAKAEADLANTRSLINQRAEDNAIDYSDPILSLYTQTTGEVVSSPSKARAVMGYADSLLSGKEVVGNDFTGPLLDNQIRESEARSIMTDAFTKFVKTEKGDAKEAVWQWLATEEAQGLSDEEKKQQIMQAGQNPEDFGIY